MGAWVLYANLGYLRSVYAGLRRVEGTLHGSTCQKNAYASAYAHAEVSRLHLNLRNLTPAKKSARAYTESLPYAGAALQNIHDQPTQHMMIYHAVPSYPNFMISKKKNHAQSGFILGYIDMTGVIFKLPVMDVYWVGLYSIGSPTLYQQKVHQWLTSP